MNIKHVILVLSMLIIPNIAQAQYYSQDNVFGDNIMQNNYYNRPANRVVKKTTVNRKNVTNNTYIINQVNPAPVVVAPPQPQIIEQTVTVTRSVRVPGQPPIPVPMTPSYYYPPQSFY